MTAHLPRPLTPAEAAVLDRMLSLDVRGVAALRQQAGTAVVVADRWCGCPSVELAVAEEAPVAEGVPDGPLWVDGEVDTAAAAAALGVTEYTGYAVILFVRAGRLSGLELSHYDAPPSSWPPPEAIRVY